MAQNSRDAKAQNENEWTPVGDVEEGQFEVGDEVQIRYKESDGSADENPREDPEFVEESGEISKLYLGVGGVHVQANGINGPNWRRLHYLPGGTVTGHYSHGNREVRLGVDAEIRPAN